MRISPYFYLYAMRRSSHNDGRVRRLLKQHQFVKLCNWQWPQRAWANAKRKKKIYDSAIMWLEKNSSVVIVVSIENILTNLTHLSQSRKDDGTQVSYLPPQHSPIEINLSQTWTAIELHVKRSLFEHKVAITSAQSSYHFWNYFTIFQLETVSRHLSIINVYHDCCCLKLAVCNFSNEKYLFEFIMS